jgi:AcrR family transcriptional regulator
MRPAPPHAPDTRERILDTAERLFAERGFAGTSVREITDAAAANLGAVNYHFQSKENLYAEVFARRAARLREPMAAAASEAAGIARERPEEALRALGRVFLAPHNRRETALRLLGLLTRETVEKCLPSGFLAREFQAPAIEAFRSVVRQIRPAIEDAVALACAHSFFAQLVYIARNAARGAGTPLGSLEDQLDHAVRFTVAAVRHIEGAPGKSARSQVQS